MRKILDTNALRSLDDIRDRGQRPAAQPISKQRRDYDQQGEGFPLDRSKIVERPIEEVRRKTIIASLEPRGIYVHEVPALAIEKKAFYTDLLLGMVFFYDSLKSGAE